MKNLLLVIAILGALMSAACGLGSVDVVVRESDDALGYIKFGIKDLKDETDMRQLGIQAIRDAYKGKSVSGTFFLDYSIEEIGARAEKPTQLRMHACVERHFSNYLGTKIQSCSQMDFTGEVKVTSSPWKDSDGNERSYTFVTYTPSDKNFRVQLQENIRQAIEKDIDR
jgi:hypothetical protein